MAQISGLSGVSAQQLFLWFPVKGIRVDIPSSCLIYFDVGVVFKQFSLSLFETLPDCMELTTTNLLLNPTQQEVGQVFKSSQTSQLLSMRGWSVNLIERENKQGSGCHNHRMLFQQKEKMRQGHQVEANSGVECEL
ncbi:hypothetical protein CFP56_017891 [Quercus suber]|uniref:Uncharacterized protein n=1 Tax=Quercus suber TaxID=58331 RepID=A0AAW0KLE6_QUESU